MKHLIPVLFTIALAQPSYADQHDSNGNLWLNYLGSHRIEGTDWGVHLEGQMRRSELGDEGQQLLLRSGINYHLSDVTTLTVGYAHVDTYRYGDFPAPHEFPENRFWEQVAHTTKWAGLEWLHRFRLEQRWIGEMKNNSGDWNVANWRYENRFRYMLRTTIPLTESKKTYVAISNEVFLNFGENVMGNDFDQNRAFIGIGYKFDAVNRVEFGFMEQTIQRRGGKIWEHNHTPVLWLMSSISF